MMHLNVDDAPGFSLLGDHEANPKTVWGACGYVETQKATRDLKLVTCKNCKRTKKFKERTYRARLL